MVSIVIRNFFSSWNLASPNIVKKICFLSRWKLIEWRDILYLPYSQLFEESVARVKVNASAKFSWELHHCPTNNRMHHPLTIKIGNEKDKRIGTHKEKEKKVERRCMGCKFVRYVEWMQVCTIQWMGYKYVRYNVLDVFMYNALNGCKYVQ